MLLPLIAKLTSETNTDILVVNNLDMLSTKHNNIMITTKHHQMLKVVLEAIYFYTIF